MPDSESYQVPLLITMCFFNLLHPSYEDDDRIRATQASTYGLDGFSREGRLELQVVSSDSMLSMSHPSVGAICVCLETDCCASS